MVISALGLLEANDMVATVDTADAMLKAANVCLLSYEMLDPGRLVLVVEGDLTAYCTTLDVGSVVAVHTGRAINHKGIGRSDNNTQWLIDGFRRQPRKPEQESEAKTEVKPEKTQNAPATSESSTQPLTLLASVRQRMTVGGMATHSG